MAVSKRNRKAKSPRGKTTLETYRAIRKPVAPPGRIERDRRRAMERKRAREEIDEGLAGKRTKR